MSFNKTITIHQGYDRRASGGGIHGAEVVFALQGEHGAVTFAVQTEWVPKAAAEESITKNPSRPLDIGMNPKPLDTTFHFDKPLYVAHQQERTTCPYMPNKMQCYSMRRNELSPSIRDALLNSGSDAVWKVLERHYKEMARMNGVQQEQA